MIYYSSKAIKSKEALSELLVQILYTALSPGKVAFYGSADNFILERPFIFVSLQTSPKAGCFLQDAILVPIA